MPSVMNGQAGKMEDYLDILTDDKYALSWSGFHPVESGPKRHSA